MSSHFHAMVWIDHHQAKVFHFNTRESECNTVHSSRPTLHLHHKANSGDSGHAPVDNHYLEQVVKALGTAGAILITGPGSAKTELAAYIKRAHPPIAQRISAVETLDHPTEGELLAHGRTFFKADDRMHSQTSRKA